MEFKELTLEINAPDSVISKTLKVNATTEYGEPQIYIDLSDGTSVVITQERNGLRERDWYFTVKQYCSKEDKETGKYEVSLGVVSSFRYANIEQLTSGLSIFMKKVYSNNITILD